MIKRFFVCSLAFYLYFVCLCASDNNEIKDFSVSPAKLTDGKLNTYTKLDSITLSGVSGHGECHKTQHQYWFYEWLNKREKAADITSYSPCEFGLYYSSVGTDITGGDMFENIKTYAELETEQKPSEEDIGTLTPRARNKNPKRNHGVLYSCRRSINSYISVILIVIRNKKR